MILDGFLKFSSGQDLSQIVGTYASTNSIDFGIGTSTNTAIPSGANGGGARDMGIGDPSLKFLVQVVEAFVSAGGGTLQIHLQGAPDDGTGAEGSYTTWWSSPIYAIANLGAGRRLFDIPMPRPPSGVAVPRFIRLLYQIATATTTAGTVDAYLVLDREDQMYNSTDNSVRGGYRAGLNVAN